MAYETLDTLNAYNTANATDPNPCRIAGWGDANNVWHLFNNSNWRNLNSLMTLDDGQIFIGHTANKYPTKGSLGTDTPSFIAIAAAAGSLKINFQITSDIDFQLHGLVNAVLEGQASDPFVVTEGRIFWDSTLKTIKVGNTTAGGYVGFLPNALSDGKIFFGNASNIAVEHTPSGDVTASNTGVFTIANDSVTPSKMSASAKCQVAQARVILDLSGGASSSIIFHATKAATITKIRALYSEASSSDTGVQIDVGKQGSASYFYTGTSEADKALYDYSDLTPLQTAIAANDTVVCSTAGGKTGTGEVLFILEYRYND